MFMGVSNTKTGRGGEGFCGIGSNRKFVEAAAMVQDCSPPVLVWAPLCGGVESLPRNETSREGSIHIFKHSRTRGVLP